MRILVTVLAILAQALLYSGACAQIVWHEVFPLQRSSEYLLRDLSCIGDTCIACGREQFTDPFGVQEIILRTTDGGDHWSKSVFPTQFSTGDGFYCCQAISKRIAVVGGDKGLVLRTNDGGASWHQQSGLDAKIHYINFHDSAEGIALSEGSHLIYTTRDAGKSWKQIPFYIGTSVIAKAEGNGAFRAYRYGAGPIYSTKDNWVTIDSTPMVFDPWIDTNAGKLLPYCNFSPTGDTVVAFGIDNHRALVYTSIDRGYSWIESQSFASQNVGPIMSMSSLEFDTVIAAGDILSRHCLISVDRGHSWKVDTLLLDSSLHSDAVGCSNLSNGRLMFLASQSGLRNNSIIFRSGESTSRVETSERIHWGTRIYPNPAASRLTISVPDPFQEVSLIDMLGRVVFRGTLSSDGNITFNVSNLSPGIYGVVLNHDGAIISLSKVLVIR